MGAYPAHRTACAVHGACCSHVHPLSALTFFLLKLQLDYAHAPLHLLAWHSQSEVLSALELLCRQCMSLLQLQSDVFTRRSYAAQVRQVAEDSNDETTFRICSRFLAQTNTPLVVYGLMLMPMTVLLWRFLELLDIVAAKGYLKPTLPLVDC